MGHEEASSGCTSTVRPVRGPAITAATSGIAALPCRVVRYFRDRRNVPRALSTFCPASST